MLRSRGKSDRKMLSLTIRLANPWLKLMVALSQGDACGSRHAWRQFAFDLRGLYACLDRLTQIVLHTWVSAGRLVCLVRVFCRVT
jgi:hypothetical protein